MTGLGRVSSRSTALSTLALVFSLVIAAEAGPGRSKSSKTPAEPKGVTRFSPDGGANKTIADWIRRTDKTLDIAIYSISPEGPIMRALEDAVKRKVRIRMVLHKATSSNRELAKIFAKAGIDVYGVGPTMHHKFAILDGKVLLNGSGNWSTAADNRFNEGLMMLRSSPRLVSDFEEEFKRLLESARTISKTGKVGPEPKDRSEDPPGELKRGARVAFSSLNDGDETWVVADEIIDAMKSAKTSIDIMVAHFNSERIAAALIKLRKDHPKRGKGALKIRVLLDRGEYDDKKSRAPELEKAGIDVRYKVYSLGFHFPRAQLMHHKAIIVDDERLVTGSYNWSDTAEHTNYENVVMLDAGRKTTVKSREAGLAEQAQIVRDFAREFERLWELGRENLAGFTAAVTSKKGKKGYRSVVPIHFDRRYFNTPMAMSRDELDPIMEVARKAGLEGNESESYLSKNTKRPLAFVRGKLIRKSKSKSSKGKDGKKDDKKAKDDKKDEPKKKRKKVKRPKST